MLKKILIGLIIVFVLTGCKGCTEDRVETDTKNDSAPIANNVPAPDKTVSPTEQKIEILKKKLDESDKRAAEAAANGEIIAKLSAEKDSLGLKVQLAEAYAKEWEQNAKSYSSQKDEKEKELSQAKLDAWKEKLWWMAGICGLLSIVGAGVAWGFPLLRPIATKASIIFGAIAGIMLVVAQMLSTIAWLLGLVPYILGIAILAVIIYGIVALRHWFKDHSSLQQTIEGIEPIKKNIKGFGDHMLKHVDGTMVEHIKSYKKKIREKANKAITSVKK